MQISRTQNQPNFKARIVNEAAILAKVKAEDAQTARLLKEQIELMRKIGNNKTTQYYLGYAGKKSDTVYNMAGKPFTLTTVVNTIDGKKPKGFRETKFNLTVQLLAKQAQESLSEALSELSPTAQKSVTEHPNRLLEGFLELFQSKSPRKKG